MNDTPTFSTDVLWPSGRPATNPGWSYAALPDGNVTVLPSGSLDLPWGNASTSTSLWEQLISRLPSSGPLVVGLYDGSAPGRGGIDIGIFGFGLGPDWNSPVKAPLGLDLTKWLLIAAAVGLTGILLLRK